MCAVIPSFALSLEQQLNYVDLHRSSPVEGLRYLADTLGLLEYKHDARSAITLDLVAAVVEQCEKLHLNAQQTSAVLGIGHRLLQCCADGASRDHAQQQLRSSLLQLCSSTPAAQIDTETAATLSPEAISALAAGFTKGILQHYSLYVLVFTQEQAHRQHQYHLPVESAVIPPPLQQALPEQDWLAHLAAEKAARDAEQAAAAAAAKAAREADEAARIAELKAKEEAVRQEQLQRKPKTLDEAVDKLVALKMEDVQQALTAGYTAKAASLVTKVAQLEQQQQVLQLQQQQQQMQMQAGAAQAATKPMSKGGSTVASAAKGH